MKNNLNYFVFFLLLISGSLFAQNTQSAQTNTSTEGTKVKYIPVIYKYIPPKKKSVKEDILGYKLPTYKNSPVYRKLMPFDKENVWILGTNNFKGHWDKPQSHEIGINFKNKPFYNYSVTEFEDLKPYNEATVENTIGFGLKKNSKLPKKGIDLDKIDFDPDWNYKETSIIFKEGKKGQINLSFLKNIERGKTIIIDNDFDLIIVTDTLFAPISFATIDVVPLINKRSYIKVIANYIIYDTPITPRTHTRFNKTDYVFSSDSIFFKTEYKSLKKEELTPAPPFVINAGKEKIKLHKDYFGKTEKILVNRLLIEIMIQIRTELNQIDNDWEMDKLLIEFQKYKHKVRIELLSSDLEYNEKWINICDNFDSSYENKIERNRKINGLTVFVEGKVKDLHKNPFKYYAIPSKATLVPVMDENTGILNKLGNLLFKVSSDSKLSVTMEVKLGYEKEAFKKTNKILNYLGFTLDKNFPENLLFVNEQPLKIKGKITGEIIPIHSDILKLKIELQDENLTLIKLLAKNKSNSFSLNYKAYDSRKEFRQKVVFEVPYEIIKQIDYENMLNEFNVIEMNTITDLVKITSNLSSNLGEEEGGALNYIEVSLEFLFDNDKVVFRGPFKMSSAFVLGSEERIPFVKYSENYSIKVTGKAYYENGVREIKDDLIITSPFIELEEGIFKDATSN